MTCIRHMSKTSVMLLSLGLTIVLLAACNGASSTQNQNTSSGFHTTLKTSDGMFQIQFAVTPDHTGLNTFTVNVNDANTGKPATNVQVQVFTTMLDMQMGTDSINLPSSGQGTFSTQGSLSMNGNWRIRILLRTPDTNLHEAQLHLSTQA